MALRAAANGLSFVSSSPWEGEEVGSPSGSEEMGRLDCCFSFGFVLSVVVEVAGGWTVVVVAAGDLGAVPP